VGFLKFFLNIEKDMTYRAGHLLLMFLCSINQAQFEPNSKSYLKVEKREETCI
jgi:hypothetical protein